MTDKVTAEVPSSFAGTIKQIIANAGDTIKVGEVICTIETKEKNDVHLAKVSEEIRKNDAEQKMISPQKQRYSPAVLKLSQEYGIDLRTVQGTGKGGRITRKDILQRIKENKNMKKDVQITQSAPVIVPAIESSKVMETHKDTIIPVTPLRQVIANNMVKAKQEIPHAWMMVEVDVTNLVEFRNGIKDEFKQRRISYYLFLLFVKAVAQALKEFPQLNSTWQGRKLFKKGDQLSDCRSG